MINHDLNSHGWTGASKKEAAGAKTATTAGSKINQRSVGPAVSEEKRFQTLRARFALLGHSLHRSANGGFFSQRWAMTRDLPTLDDAEALLEQMGGRNG
jgi:hypothetical protein